MTDQVRNRMRATKEEENDGNTLCEIGEAGKVHGSLFLSNLSLIMSKLG